MRKGLDSSSAMALVTGKATTVQLPLASRITLAVNQTLTCRSSIFVHARDTVDRKALISGSKVSFIYEPDEEGGKAREVAVEEMAEATALNEGPREMGKVMVSLTTLPYLIPCSTQLWSTL